VKFGPAKGGCKRGWRTPGYAPRGAIIPGRRRRTDIGGIATTQIHEEIFRSNAEVIPNDVFHAATHRPTRSRSRGVTQKTIGTADTIKIKNASANVATRDAIQRYVLIDATIGKSAGRVDQ
jgi:hypothetical protein